MMVLKAIINKLNTSVKIYLIMDSPIFRFSKDFNFSPNAFIEKSSKNWFIKIFIPKNINIDKIKPLFPLFNVEKRSDYYILTDIINNHNIINFIKEIDVVNGLRINGFRMVGHSLEITLSLPENKKYELSSIINKEILKSNFINDIKIYNENLIDRLNNKNAESPLYIIKVSVDSELFTNSKLIKLLSNKEAISELIDNYPENDSFRVFIYTEEKLMEDDAYNISDNIYETAIKNEIIMAISKKANSMFIFRDYVFFRLMDKRIVITTVMPEFRSMEYLKILYSISTEFNIKIDLEAFDKYTDDIFNNN